MSNWLGTNSGMRIDLTNPDPDQFTLNDIAYSLSKVCRFAGQIETFYSVAEHSLNVASIVSSENKLQALMHDAPEAYLCDIPTPLKREMGTAYTDIEDRVWRAICTRFLIEPELSAEVKEADRIMCVSERDKFVKVVQDWGPVYERTRRAYVPDMYQSPDDIAEEFKERFRFYGGIE